MNIVVGSVEQINRIKELFRKQSWHILVGWKNNQPVFFNRKRVK